MSYICNSQDHLAKQCQAFKTESRGDGNQSNPQHKSATSKKVESDSKEDAPKEENQEDEFNLMDILYSSNSDDEVKSIRVSDEGSKARCARVLVQGCWCKEYQPMVS